MYVDEYVTALHNVARDCNLGSTEQYDDSSVATRRGKVPGSKTSI